MKYYIIKITNLIFSPYFKAIFSPNLIIWSESIIVGPSHGNGAMVEALSGIDNKYIEMINNKIPDNFVRLLKRSKYEKSY